MRRELGTRITSALDRLTPRERMVFELKHLITVEIATVGEILHTQKRLRRMKTFVSRHPRNLRGGAHWRICDEK